MGHWWTQEEITFLREVYPYHENKEIVKMVKDKFGLDVSIRSIQYVKQAYGIPDKVTNSGCYKKGDVPWNKGKGMSEEIKEKVKDTWFKKGELPLNHRPVGSTRITVDGYKEIKIKDPDKWQLYHRYIYEKEHGVKLTTKDIIIFADRDKTNFDVDNLVKVSRANLAYLNKNGLIFKDKEVTKACVGISKLAVKVSNLKKDKKIKK